MGIILEIEDCLCFICCIILSPLYPIFYLIDYIFNTEIMYDGNISSKVYNEIDD